MTQAPDAITRGWKISLLAVWAIAFWPVAGNASSGDTVEFCLDGGFDLGVHLQGMQSSAGVFSASSWCVITEDGSVRVRAWPVPLQSARGRSPGAMTASERPQAWFTRARPGISSPKDLDNVYLKHHISA